MVRGKKKLGYEMDIELTTVDGIQIVMNDICDDDDDCSDLIIKSNDKTVQETVRKERKALVARVKKAMELFKNNSL